MEIKLYDLGKIKEERLRSAVIVSVINNRFVYVRHKGKKTWELSGGLRLHGENIDGAASRELKEETGAVKFSMIPVSDYSIKDEKSGTTYGRIYYSEIEELGRLSDIGVEEIMFSEYMPKNLTYPEIQPVFLGRVIDKINRNH